MFNILLTPSAKSSLVLEENKAAFCREGRIILLFSIVITGTVSEIKGAPCTRRAHFHGRVHDFRRCAPGVCTFFEPFIIAIYWEGALSNFRVHNFMGSAPCECTK